MNLGVRLAESGRVPDSLLRAAIRARHRAVLRREDPGSAEARQQTMREFLAHMSVSPVAPAPSASNEQHYEVPTRFFQEILGPRLKYSGCVWPEAELGGRPGPDTEAEQAMLAQAEEAMLALTAKRARLADGQRILDLGCGWGSFGLYAAQTYPGCSVLAVSNSATQGAYIRDRARELGLANIEVATADMNAFDPGDTAPFDRVVSVEMFEHMRNWGELLRRISTWLAPSGKCFVHVFAHRELVYPFREGPGEWMSRYFFAGGVMPADALLLHLQRDMVVEDHWRVDGRHYARTLDSWLALLDGRRERIMSIMTETYGATEPAVWLQRWRMFMMACSELFGYRGGSEWLVSHYRLGKRGQS